mgnify:FL=1
MSHDLTPAQVDAIVERSILQRQKQRAYQKSTWAQINLRLRIGSNALKRLDYIRGDVTRTAYVNELLENHLNQVSNLFADET